MKESEHDEGPAREDLALAATLGHRPWTIAGALGLIVFTAVLVVSFISATNDNARIERMRDHGIPVTVTVADCIGNIGGSGSNAAGFTCRGEYTVNDTLYHEVIGSMSTFSAPGSVVHGIADPSKHSSVVLASAIKTSVASPTAYVAPGLLTIVLIALTLVFFRLSRRSASLRRSPSVSSGPGP